MPSYPCFGFDAFGPCAYDPSNPQEIYFSLGAAIAALAFTLAAQQLLKPVYRFRLSARHLSLSKLYGFVFLGVAATAVAALLPNLPVPRTGPLAYPLVWELLATALFSTAYAAVVYAIVRPVRMRAKNADRFAAASATLLSSASTEDHIQYARDLERSLPILIRTARFTEHIRDDQVTAFFEFIHRKRLKQSGYAWSLLRIIADPAFCAALVTRDSWALARMLRNLADERLRSRSLEEFIEQLGAQAVIRDDSMLAREIEYRGFGAAPLLSDSLFSEPFILDAYNPFGGLSLGFEGPITVALLKRFNEVAEKAYIALIDSGSIWHVSSAHSIARFYEQVFQKAWIDRKKAEWGAIAESW